MSLSGRASWVALVVVALLTAGCGTTSHQVSDRGADTVTTVGANPDLRVVAVGDIACPPGQPASGTRCRQAATASLARSLHPDLVLTLGDHQYDRDSLAQFEGSYAKSWGGSLLSKTRPALGNHEYMTPGAQGYYTYFADRQPGPPGYYRVAAGGWNIYVLNSNCGKVSCAAEATWLDRQMAAHPSKCSIITMHHPRYSSGLEHGNNTAVKPLWSAAYKHRNDIVLSGHDHDYERFYPMNASGGIRRATGMREFVSGTGGNSLYHLGTRKHGSIYFQARTAGVLFLGLESGAYRWSYRSIRGSVMDSGRTACH